jgi:hypothetical protein
VAPPNFTPIIAVALYGFEKILASIKLNIESRLELFLRLVLFRILIVMAALTVS